MDIFYGLKVNCFFLLCLLIIFPLKTAHINTLNFFSYKLKLVNIRLPDIVCPVPKLPDASGMMGYRSVYRFGDTVRINCNPGFRFAEEYYVKCGIDGEWTPEPSKLCLSSRVANYLHKRSLAWEVTIYQLHCC